MAITRKWIVVGAALFFAAAGLSWWANEGQTIERSERQAAMEPCANPLRASGTYHLSELLVGRREQDCARWIHGIPGFVAIAGTVRPSGVPLPAVVYGRRSSDAAATAIFVKVVGGPGGSIAPDTGDRRYLDLLGPNDFLVNIGYTGTRYRTLYPKPDFKTACTEVSAYLVELRRRNPDAKLVIIGESLGGPIVAGALQISRDVDAVILVSPMMFSPFEGNDNFVSVLKHGYRNDTKIAVRKLADQAQPWSDGHWSSEYSIDLFAAFFEKTEMNVDLRLRLAGFKIPPMLIVFGGADDVIGRTKLADLSSLPGLTLFEVSGMKHTVDPPFAGQVTSAIRRFLRFVTARDRSGNGSA